MEFGKFINQPAKPNKSVFFTYIESSTYVNPYKERIYFQVYKYEMIVA